MAPSDHADTPQPIWARPATVAAIVLGMAIMKLWVAGNTELVFDEGYYTLWSLHLAASYLDHPPAVAWLIALGRTLVGQNEVGVRLMSILGDIAIAAAIYRMGRILFDARTAAAATLWHTVSIAAALGLLMTPDAPSILFWTLTLWAIAEFIASENPNWWLLCGVFAGLGLDSKLTNLFLAPGILLFVLSSKERRVWLGLWQVWTAPLIALGVFSPVIAWNAANNWVTFWFQGRRTLGAEASATGFFNNMTEMIGGQALAVGPPLIIFAAIAGILLARRQGPKQGLALGLLTALPLLLYFVVHATHSRVEVNWLLPVWPGLTLCGAWAALSLRPGRAWNWLVWTVRNLQLPYGVVVIAVVFTQALFFPFPSVSFDRTRDLHGWRILNGQIEDIARANGAHWIVNAGDYGLTGELAAYGHFAGDPYPVHQLDDRLRYGFRGPFDPGGMGWPALYVSTIGNPSAPVPPDHYFNQSQLLSVLERTRGGEVLTYYEVYLVSDPTPAFLAYAGS